MDLYAAIEELNNFKKVRRKIWEKHVYIQKENNFIIGYRQQCIPFVYDLDIINSDGWKIVGKEEEFTFSEAIQHVLDNKKIRLKSWPESTCIEMTSDRKDLFMRNITEYNFVPTFECFIAKDWEVIE